jgi:hypothetical protein
LQLHSYISFKVVKKINADQVREKAAKRGGLKSRGLASKKTLECASLGGCQHNGDDQKYGQEHHGCTRKADQRRGHGLNFDVQHLDGQIPAFAGGQAGAIPPLVAIAMTWWAGFHSSTLT